MDIPDSLLCLFNGEVERRNGTYVIEVPKHELDAGVIQDRQMYRVGLFPAADVDVETENEEISGGFTGQIPGTQLGTRSSSNSSSSDGETGEKPPVEEGDTQEVEIEDLGEQGDGIARIGPGYVVFVPSTDIGDRVKVRITDARDNFAFADVVDHL